jgi:hypothetical protein
MAGNMNPKTPQEKGYAWEEEVARAFGGKLTTGSGNRNYARLDVTGQGFVISAKHTIHKSFSVSAETMQDARSVAMGPNGVDPSIVPILAVKMEESGLEIAVVEMATLIDWLRSPPELVPPTPMQNIRAQARRNPLGLDDD